MSSAVITTTKGESASAADLGEELEAVIAGQADVEQHEADAGAAAPLHAKLLPRLLGAPGLVERHAGPLAGARQHETDGGFVVDDENLAQCSLHRGLVGGLPVRPKQVRRPLLAINASSGMSASCAGSGWWLRPPPSGDVEGEVYGGLGAASTVRFFTSIRPPCASMIRREMARPRPVPWGLEVGERREEPVCIMAPDRRAVVQHRDPGERPGPAAGRANAQPGHSGLDWTWAVAVEHGLHRVADEVQDHLSELFLSPMDRGEEGS